MPSDPHTSAADAANAHEGDSSSASVAAGLPIDRLAPLTTSEQVEALAESIFGGPLQPGVIHLTAVWRVNAAADWRQFGSEYVTMKTCESTPPSDHDFFVLNYGRVFCDAIITTGGNVREDAGMHFAMAGPAAAGLLEAWQRRHGQRPQTILFITRGQDAELLFSHRMFGPPHDRPLEFVFFTRSESAPRLQAAAAARGLANVRVVGVPEPTPAAALEHLRAAGCRSVAVEAGPSTAKELHAAGAVDTLLLSVLHTPAIAPEVVPPSLAFLPHAAVEARYAPAAPPHRIASPHAPEGVWEFVRYERRRGPGA